MSITFWHHRFWGYYRVASFFYRVSAAVYLVALNPHTIKCGHHCFVPLIFIWTLGSTFWIINIFFVHCGCAAVAAQIWKNRSVIEGSCRESQEDPHTCTHPSTLHPAHSGLGRQVLMSADYSRGFRSKWGEIIALCEAGLSEVTARARAAPFCSASLCSPAWQSNLTQDVTGTQLKEKDIFSSDLKLQGTFMYVVVVCMAVQHCRKLALWRKLYAVSLKLSNCSSSSLSKYLALMLSLYFTFACNKSLKFLISWWVDWLNCTRLHL